jgi:capsular polysaccharide biosynthesis protein
MSSIRSKPQEQTTTPSDGETRLISAADSEARARGFMSGPPSGYFLLVPPQQAEDAVSIGTVMRILADSWKTLVLTSLACAIVTAGILLTMRNVYRGIALIAPVVPERMGALGSLSTEIGGIAALAGVDVTANTGPKAEAFAALNSPGFTRDFITSQNLMPILFADRWDPATHNWRKGKKPPTLEAAAKMFMTTVRTITQDRKTGLIKVTVEWYSPELAAAWANGMVDIVNDRLRAIAIRDADLSIEYLNKELAKTNVVEVQHAIYQVMEDQVQRAMLANVQREYAFRVIDRAVPPVQKAGPLRGILTIVGAGVGLFLGIIIVFVRRALRHRSPVGSQVDTRTQPT